MDDAELVRQAAAGRAAAYGQLARRHAPRVLALCHARTARPDVAEDLAQEALLRGWRAIGTLKEPAKFAHWLCGISTRVCLDWLKSVRRHPEVPMSILSVAGAGDGDTGVLAGAAGETPTAAEAVEHEDELRALVAEVERLPPEYREVLMLFYYQDCSYQEIAATLGVSPATANARLTKARALLRQRMSRRVGREASRGIALGDAAPPERGDRIAPEERTT